MYVNMKQIIDDIDNNCLFKYEIKKSNGFCGKINK